jgi:hypothetical protein
MALPAISCARHSPQDLERFDALLAQPPIVQHRRAGGEIRVGQKGLHD